ncbi:hypothetical protein AB3N59_18605 [Leptospira sp. WS92.C1]
MSISENTQSASSRMKKNSHFKKKISKFFIFTVLIGVFILESSFSILSQPKIQDPARSLAEGPESKPLLRVFPSFRKEECDWAIRWDICLSCMKLGRRYAQKIHFYPSGPYREHGCYSEKEGFFLMEE